MVVQWTVPLLAALALQRLWCAELPAARLRRALAWAAGVTGGLCLLFAVAGGQLFDFGPRGRRGADDRAVQPYFAGQRRRRSAATGTRRDDRRGGRCGDGRRAGRDDDGRRLAVAALRAPHGGRRGADDRASGVARCGRRACGRAGRGQNLWGVDVRYLSSDDFVSSRAGSSGRRAGPTS